MGRIKVKNTSGTNIGLSCIFMQVGREAVLDESKLTDGDRRMIKNKGMLVEVLDAPKFAPPPPEPVLSVKTVEIAGQFLNAVTLAKEEEPNEPKNKTTVVTVDVEPVVAPPSKQEPPAPAPVAGPSVADAAPQVSTPAEIEAQLTSVAKQSEEQMTNVTKYTLEQLEALGKKELKDLSKGLGADARSRKSMIEKILASQEK